MRPTSPSRTQNRYADKLKPQRKLDPVRTTIDNIVADMVEEANALFHQRLEKHPEKQDELVADFKRIKGIVRKVANEACEIQSKLRRATVEGRYPSNEIVDKGENNIFVKILRSGQAPIYGPVCGSATTIGTHAWQFPVESLRSSSSSPSPNGKMTPMRSSTPATPTFSGSATHIPISPIPNLDGSVPLLGIASANPIGKHAWQFSVESLGSSSYSPSPNEKMTPLRPLTPTIPIFNGSAPHIPIPPTLHSDDSAPSFSMASTNPTHSAAWGPRLSFQPPSQLDRSSWVWNTGWRHWTPSEFTPDGGSIIYNSTSGSDKKGGSKGSELIPKDEFLSREHKENEWREKQREIDRVKRQKQVERERQKQKEREEMQRKQEREQKKRERERERERRWQLLVKTKKAEATRNAEILQNQDEADRKHQETGAERASNGNGHAPLSHVLGATDNEAAEEDVIGPDELTLDDRKLFGIVGEDIERKILHPYWEDNGVSRNLSNPTLNNDSHSEEQLDDGDRDVSCPGKDAASCLTGPILEGYDGFEQYDGADESWTYTNPSPKVESEVIRLDGAEQVYESLHETCPGVTNDIGYHIETAKGRLRKCDREGHEGDTGGAITFHVVATDALCQASGRPDNLEDAAANSQEHLENAGGTLEHAVPFLQPAAHPGVQGIADLEHPTSSGESAINSWVSLTETEGARFSDTAPAEQSAEQETQPGDGDESFATTTEERMREDLTRVLTVDENAESENAVGVVDGFQREVRFVEEHVIAPEPLFEGKELEVRSSDEESCEMKGELGGMMQNALTSGNKENAQKEEFDVVSSQQTEVSRQRAIEEVLLAKMEQILLKDKDKGQKYKTLLNQQLDKLAQSLLDLLQALSEHPKADTNKLRSKILAEMLWLVKKSSCHPRCLALARDRVQKLGDDPVAGGGFGDIYRASIGGEIACMKVVRIFGESDINKLLKDFLKEAILWRQLEHPNVLPFSGLYFLDETKRRVCLMSPWMSNGNVLQYLKSPERSTSSAKPQPDEFRDLVTLMYDVAEGLHYLHSQKIVHGDLKAVNILVTASGRAAIADFGLSRLAETNALRSTTGNNQPGGTARWLAPECLLKRERVSYESDIYAFGCVCYEVFTGLLPFNDCPLDPQVMLELLSNRRPARPENCSNLTDGIWGIMQDCWKEEILKRPSADLLPKRLLTATGLSIERSEPWNDPLRAQMWSNVQHPQLCPAGSDLYNFLHDLDLE